MARFTLPRDVYHGKGSLEGFVGFLDKAVCQQEYVSLS